MFFMPPLCFFSFGILFNIFFLSPSTGRDKDVASEEAGTVTRGMGGAASSPTSSLQVSSRSAVGAAAKQQQGFLSDILAQLWSYINEAASQNVIETVEPQFKELPGPLSSLHFTKVDLGNVPIRLDNIVVHDVNKNTNTLQMDLDVHWDGNCDIRLKANYLGSFGVKSIKLFGRMSILMKPLVKTLALVEGVQVSFINPPRLELDFVGLANVADVKMLKRRIDTIIQDIVKDMMVLPQRQLVKLDMACSFLDIYSPPIGICRMTVKKGQGFQVEKRAMRKSDVPDCYVTMSVGNRKCQSKTIKDSISPEWDEKMDFVLCDHDQFVSMEVFDEDNGTLDSDDFLGTAEATVGDMLLHGGKREFKLQDEDMKLTGASVNVACDLLQLTPDLKSFETETTSPSEICGMVTILITQAFALPVKKEDVSTNVKITCGKQSFVTGTVADYPGLDSLNPFFDGAFHLPLTADLMEGGKVMDISLDLTNKEESLGTIKIDHATLAAAPDKTVTKKQEIGDAGASLEYRVILRGVESSKSSSGSTAAAATVAPTTDATVDATAKVGAVAETTPLLKEEPTIKVTMVKGTGFQVQKSKRRLLKKKDIPDVYCVTKFGSSPTPWRTKTIKDNVAPEWNESHTYPLMNHSQIIHVEVYDEDSRGSDDHLGTIRVTVGNVILAGGSKDVEIEADGKPTGCFVTIRCELFGEE